MKRILLSATILVAVGAFLFLTVGASNSGKAAGTYKIEFDNAFGLVSGADFKVAGVKAGSITGIGLDQKNLKAVVTVQVTQQGFGSFRSDAFCQTRPQSLIGEYFVDCQPGNSGRVLKPGSTIPVTRTESTIPADLLANVMRMPYRQRFTLIINELGAGVAARSGDLQAALRRAVPALTQTDNLLNLLANDSHTLQQLTVNSDAVISALANNSAQVRRFIVEANRAATATATQDGNLRLTFQKLPTLLEELRPTMQKLGVAAAVNIPPLRNLHAASAELDRLFTQLPGFSQASLPALRSLGQASITGKQAVQAAGPAISNLNQFAKPTPELAKNLAIVLHDLDDRSRAVEADSRSPGGKGYTGLEAVLQYVFNQTLAINSFSQFGHLLAVDAFIDPSCSPYATPSSVAKGLSTDPNYRRCYAWIGPNQPGINETDPSDPSACVPDPGGAPPGEKGPKTTACKLNAAADTGSSSTRAVSARTSHGHGAATATDGSGGSSAGNGSGSGGGSPPGPGPVNLGQTLGRIIGVFGGRGSRPASGIAAATSAGSAAGTGHATGQTAASSGGQAQQLLNYLLAP